MLQNIFDSHAHYNNPRFDDDQHALLAQLHSQGVANIMNIGANLETSRSGLLLAQLYDFVHCTVGIHPSDTAGLPGDYLERLRGMAASPRVRAIGEIGLDYFHNKEDIQCQQRRFREQLALARVLHLPVVVHSRDAHADTLEILKEYHPRGVVHCFSGSAELARELVQLGLYLGFTGVITFKNARRALEAAQAVPLERLLVETDCPYMAPEPYRGQRCHSGMLVQVLETLAEIKGVSAQELADITSQNAKTLYGIA